MKLKGRLVLFEGQLTSVLRALTGSPKIFTGKQADHPVYSGREKIILYL